MFNETRSVILKRGGRSIIKWRTTTDFLMFGQMMDVFTVMGDWSSLSTYVSRVFLHVCSIQNIVAEILYRV